MVGDIKLSSGRACGFGGGGGLQILAASADGEVDVVFALPGITTWFGLAAGTDTGDSEWEQDVPQPCRFPGAEDNAHVGEGDPEGGDELDQFAVFDRKLGLEFPGRRPQPREADGEGRLPAVAVEVFQVRGKGEGLAAPVGQSEQGTDPDAAEASLVGALRALEAPVEIAFRAGGVQPLVDPSVIGFLVNHQAFGTGGNHLGIFLAFHRADLQTDGGDKGAQCRDALPEVSVGDKFRVFTGDQQDVAEAQRCQMAGFPHDLVDRQGDPENGVVAGETTVAAVVDTFIGKVEGREQAHGAAKMLAGDGGGLDGQGFNLAGACRCGQ